MRILIIEPYYTGSHKQWAEGYQHYSKHEITIISMQGKFWKWRMHGGAITLANQYRNLNETPDLILVTDMLDLTTFLALTKTRAKTAIYFHENQLSYPWSPKDRDIIKKRDNHYGFINYSSALVADHVFFNSKFHMNAFINDLNPFLKNFPDYRELNSIEDIQNKSTVLHLGLWLEKFETYKREHHSKPLILWNHRWEYDKNPEFFFTTLKKVKNANYDFDLVILGENFSNSPNIFSSAKNIFKENIIHWGYAKEFSEYAKWLWRANILPVTSHHDFFGASVMEAIYCQTYPILPNRLSYPELIPNQLHKKIIYNNDEELYEKIVGFIDNYDKQNFQKIKKIAKPYNWEILAPDYDSKMESIL